MVSSFAIMVLSYNRRKKTNSGLKNGGRYEFQDSSVIRGHIRSLPISMH